ncbi:MAG: helicase-related protein, partial [Oceanospirillaceae bacterium]|nr:helicase-related protein [Oceanospirillaceae bacterium]
LTATATKKVKLDMAKRFAIAPEHIVQTGFYRENLDLNVIPTQEQQKASTLLQLIEQQQGCGIVYVTLQHTAEQVAVGLAAAGVLAKAYHAGLGDEVRQQVQQDFMLGHTQVVVATIAFGMGIDKSDIRFVVHYDLPKSIENYSQEIGRAGRDGQPSRCITLGNLDGLNTVENFVYGDTPELQGIQIVLDDIRQGIQSRNTQPLSKTAADISFDGQWEVQIHGLSTQSNIRQLPLKTLLVQLELMGIVRPQYTYFADVRFKFLQDKADVLGRFDEKRQAFLNSVFEHTDFKKVWGSLNFDTLFEQTGAERSRVVAALEYLEQHQLIELQTKQMTEVYQVNST